MKVIKNGKYYNVEEIEKEFDNYRYLKNYKNLKKWDKIKYFKLNEKGDYEYKQGGLVLKVEEKKIFLKGFGKNIIWSVDPEEIKIFQYKKKIIKVTKL